MHRTRYGRCPCPLSIERGSSGEAVLSRVIFVSVRLREPTGFRKRLIKTDVPTQVFEKIVERRASFCFPYPPAIFGRPGTTSQRVAVQRRLVKIIDPAILCR